MELISKGGRGKNLINKKLKVKPHTFFEIIIMGKYRIVVMFDSTPLDCIIIVYYIKTEKTSKWIAKNKAIS